MYLLIYSHDRVTPLAACKDKYSAYTVIRSHYERIGNKFRHGDEQWEAHFNEWVTNCNREDFNVGPVDEAFRDFMAQSMGENNDEDRESLIPLAIASEGLPDGWTLVTYHKQPNDSSDTLKLAVAAVMAEQSELHIEISTRPSWVVPGSEDDWLNVTVSGCMDRVNDTCWEDHFKIQSKDWRQMLAASMWRVIRLHELSGLFDISGAIPVNHTRSEEYK